MLPVLSLYRPIHRRNGTTTAVGGIEMSVLHHRPETSRGTHPVGQGICREHRGNGARATPTSAATASRRPCCPWR